MRIVIGSEGVIKRIISYSSLFNQKLGPGEFEIEITDQDVKEAFDRGEELLYNKNTGKIYYEPTFKVDSEKAVLYEAVANLFEEVQILKAQLGGEK